ncbi:MAG: hypothetical protein QM714_14885 [Nocardioides sp.]|uniref:hypothetical protein n=1 Tax=Nocardioides sp. TaxID=35761 RepID=UPI0039E6F085
MDISAFYGLFSATCFTLVGLWWNVVQGHPQWLRDDALRRAVGGVYLAFLLPALMGLFAQVGGSDSAAVWRVSFLVISVVGAVSAIRLFSLTAEEGAAPYQAVAAVLYGMVALIGLAPELVSPLGLAPIQAVALLLILLVVIAHGLVWEFMRRAAVRDEA